MTHIFDGKDGQNCNSNDLYIRSFRLLMIPNLKALCENFLMKQFRKDNAIKIVNLAEKSRAEKLEKAALRFITANADVIFKENEVKDYY